MQQNLPIDVAHGDYFRILIPPPERCRDSTHGVLFDSQMMSIEDFWGQYYIPTSPEETSDQATNHSDVSPSLIDSDTIREEFGPRQAEPDQDDEFSQS